MYKNKMNQNKKDVDLPFNHITHGYAKVKGTPNTAKGMKLNSNPIKAIAGSKNPHIPQIFEKSKATINRTKKQIK